jgi:hypothetical protein
MRRSLPAFPAVNVNLCVLLVLKLPKFSGRFHSAVMAGIPASRARARAPIYVANIYPELEANVS